MNVAAKRPCINLTTPSLQPVRSSLFMSVQGGRFVVLLAPFGPFTRAAQQTEGFRSRLHSATNHSVQFTGGWRPNNKNAKRRGGGRT